MSTHPLPRDLGGAATRFGFNPGLDGLRAIAILCVLGAHAEFFAPGGFHGVEVFFVISGYLITSLLLSEYENSGRIGFRHFYWRRAVRLGPALLLIVIVTIAFLLATGRPIVAWLNGAIGSLTYTTDIFSLFSGSHVSTYFQWSWSLGIEEQFYLLWPVILVLILRKGRFVPSVVLLGVLALSDWLVRSFLAGRATSSNAILFGPLTHYDGLILGCILALVLNRFPGSRVLYWLSNVLGPIGLVALAWIVLTERGVIPGVSDPYDFGQTALAALALVLWVARNPSGWFSRVMAFPPIAFLGRLSYSVYLWNVFFLWIFVSIVGHRPGHSWLGILWPIVVVAVAYLSYRFVESPLRRRLAPPRAHAIVPPQPDTTEDSPAREAVS